MIDSASHQTSRQAAEPSSVTPSDPLGPSYPTPDCGYSIVNGLLYCELVHDLWLPGDPLLLNSETDYRPLMRNIRRCRRLLRRELGQTISPRRKRQIRDMREILEAALFWFELLADASNDDAGA